MNDHRVSTIAAPTSPPAPSKTTLEAVQALGRIARILEKLSEADQQCVIRALGELQPST